MPTLTIGARVSTKPNGEAYDISRSLLEETGFLVHNDIAEARQACIGTVVGLIPGTAKHFWIVAHGVKRSIYETGELTVLQT